MITKTCKKCHHQTEHHCCNICGGEITPSERKGFAVAITRKDGSEFLAASGRGLLPAVCKQRNYAVSFKRELIADGFKCRVVPVRFFDVERTDR